MKEKKKVDGDVGLIFIAYLFTRLKTILGLKGLMEAITRFFEHHLTLKTGLLPILSEIPKFYQKNPKIFPHIDLNRIFFKFTNRQPALPGL